jgi:RNA recognition motif-containing protein
MALFLGRLSQDTRSRDLEDLFGKYGRVTRLDIKRGNNSASATTNNSQQSTKHKQATHTHTVIMSSILVIVSIGKPLTHAR